MKKLLLFVAVAAAFIYLQRQPTDLSADRAGRDIAGAPAAQSDSIADAYANQRSGIAVSGEGRVSRILGDDSLGDRHQRFIVTLDSGQTVLIAHNIDLAPRVEGLQIGDAVSLKGEYEWNDRGGVVHWTHGDPQGQHEAGWLRHRGRTYQ